MLFLVDIQTEHVNTDIVLYIYIRRPSAVKLKFILYDVILLFVNSITIDLTT